MKARYPQLRNLAAGGNLDVMLPRVAQGELDIMIGRVLERQGEFKDAVRY